MYPDMTLRHADPVNNRCHVGVPVGLPENLWMYWKGGTAEYCSGQWNTILVQTPYLVNTFFSREMTVTALHWAVGWLARDSWMLVLDHVVLALYCILSHWHVWQTVKAWPMPACIPCQYTHWHTGSWKLVILRLLMNDLKGLLTFLPWNAKPIITKNDSVFNHRYACMFSVLVQRRETSLMFSDQPSVIVCANSFTWHELGWHFGMWSCIPVLNERK